MGVVPGVGVAAGAHAAAAAPAQWVGGAVVALDARAALEEAVARGEDEAR